MIVARIDKVLAAPMTVNGRTSRQPEPPKPDGDYDNDGEADWWLVGTDCDGQVDEELLGCPTNPPPAP